MFFLGFGVSPIPFSLLDFWFSNEMKPIINGMATVTYFATIFFSLLVKPRPDLLTLTFRRLTNSNVLF